MVLLYSVIVLLIVFLKERKKIKKKQLSAFLKISKKNMTCSNRDLVEKIKENELCKKVEKLIIENQKEIPLTKFDFELKAEKDFLELVTATIARYLQNCVISYFVSKKSTPVYCGTFVLTKETCRKMLQAVDKNLTEKFMSLWNLGWCSYYHLESKVMKYFDEKTQITEFYRFNRRVLDCVVEGCKCIHCRAFLF